MMHTAALVTAEQVAHIMHKRVFALAVITMYGLGSQELAIICVFFGIPSFVGYMLAEIKNRNKAMWAIICFFIPPALAILAFLGTTTVESPVISTTEYIKRPYLRCTKCGAIFSQVNQSCPFCGEPVSNDQSYSDLKSTCMNNTEKIQQQKNTRDDVILCKHCGKEISRIDTMCQICGHTIAPKNVGNLLSDHNILLPLEKKAITLCPQCSQKIALPLDKWLTVECPKCHHKFEVKT